jgi:hypothetical protein
MNQRVLFTAFFTVFLNLQGNAGAEHVSSFLDGRWSGGVETNSDGKSVLECWARTTFGDGTAFTLVTRSDESWHLRLSNPGWQLAPSRQFELVALVDFYPLTHVTAEVTSQTGLELANLHVLPLLGFIENGHTIDLASDGFKAKYDLEGSAKIIQKMRSCFAP